MTGTIDGNTARAPGKIRGIFVRNDTEDRLRRHAKEVGGQGLAIDVGLRVLDLASERLVVERGGRRFAVQVTPAESRHRAASLELVEQTHPELVDDLT